MSRTVGLPDTYRCWLKYCETVSINPAITGVTAVHSFGANNLYDPSVTGVGHQPTPYDQLAAFFGHYRVLKAIMTCRPINADAASECILSSALVLDGATQAGVTFDDLRQSERVSTNWVYSGDTSWSNVGVDGPVTIAYDPKELYGPQAVTDDSLEAQTTTSPARIPLLQVCLNSLQNGADPGAQNIHVQIMYLAEFTRPQTIGSS